MADAQYVIYGSEYSPFSVKVRSYFRYKEIPHEWRPRTKENFAEFQALAKLPLIPLVKCPDGTALQDSTPIIEKMEAQFHERSLSPEDMRLNFFSALIEEYGDEWVNKPMFHYRWWRDEDQIAVAEGLAHSIAPNASSDEQAQFAKDLRKRMVPRLSFVGSSEQNKQTIETSLDDLLALLEAHLAGRDYLFGGRPCLGDFGLFGQLYGCTQQPTTARIINQHPNVLSWINRMQDPSPTGEWESYDALASTLLPLLKNQIGNLYFPWAHANAVALQKEEATFSVMLKGAEFTQDTMKYTGRSLQKLRQKFSELSDRGALEDALLACGCLEPLLRESW
ncbi:MAG: glutathione S-transferase [Sneathiella sp.]|nr:glutathione S-transferase [Sneathiella sp.]